MEVRYAKSYVDQVFNSRDLDEMDTIVKAVNSQRDLPEPFQLFLELFSWASYSRCGIWQYYENLPTSDFESTAAQMERFNLHELAARYRDGMKRWEKPERCGDLDDWIFNNWNSIEETRLSLIEGRREALYP